jgi:hypothetical protein
MGTSMKYNYWADGRRMFRLVAEFVDVIGLPSVTFINITDFETGAEGKYVTARADRQLFECSGVDMASRFCSGQ